MIHGAEGSRSAESLARVGTFFVATRDDWLAWLDSNGSEMPGRALADKRFGRGWNPRRSKLTGRAV
ncbi:MAG: hypothetical protein HQM00_05970 [Magnetococcales bacterium]|nr:hypothetical protein [Magnetococcales bacterium]